MSEFVDYVKEVFCELGPVSARRMFGGYGVYHEGVMIALVADDELYLKVDAETVGQFKDRDLAQFEYSKGGKTVGMSYYQAPQESLEDPFEMRQWGQLAYQAAVRAKKK